MFYHKFTVVFPPKNKRLTLQLSTHRIPFQIWFFDFNFVPWTYLRHYGEEKIFGHLYMELFLKYHIFCPKNFFIQKSVMGYSNQKAEKKNFKPFWGYIDFGKVFKKRKNRNISGNIEFHGLILGQIERESKVTQKKKKKSDNPSLRYIFQVGVSAGHVVPWIADQNFFTHQNVSNRSQEQS